MAEADGAPVVLLAALDPGARARVLALSNGDPLLVRRLCDLGFAPGTEVEVVRRAPLGDPVVYRLRGFEICLRRAQAGAIRVEPVVGPVPPAEVEG
ncbi:MAG: FeoA family protein [Nocardioidaceae bacterium]